MPAFRRVAYLVPTTILCTYGVALPAVAVTTTEIRPPAGAVSVPTGAVAGVPVPAADGEIVSLRTRTSRTYATAGGAYESRLYAAPVNYRDPSGAWQPIDTRLVPAPTGYRTAANDLTVAVPANAAGPVTVTSPAGWVSYALRGASGTPAVDGSTATYAAALPATSVTLRSEADRVKEELTLADATAPATFVYDVRTSTGLLPKASGRSLDFVGVMSGKPVLSFAPPWMSDAAGAYSTGVSYRLSRALDGWTVAVALDRGWLSDPARVFPVTVDPTTQQVSPAQNTYLDKANPSTSYNGGTSLKFGMNSDGTNPFRTLLQFEVAGVVPSDAHVTSSRLRVMPRTTATLATRVYRMNRAWSNSATWNTYNGTTSWTTAGGDTTGGSEWQTNDFTSGSSSSFYITKLVAGWVDGTIPNYGVLLRAGTESGTTAVTFDSPTGTDPVRMDLTWTPRTGIRPFYEYDKRSVNDRSTVHVNVANGNLVLENHDVDIKGTGLDLKIGRYYNSRSDTPVTTGPMPTKWSLSPGRDLRLDVYNDGVMLTGVSDYKAWFINDGSSYITPAGENADLVKNGDGTYTLTYRKNGEKYLFNANGLLTQNKDRNDMAISVTYANSAVKDTQVSSITDTQGRSLTYTYTSGRLTRITDSTSRQWDYGYDSTNTYLTSYTDPGNGTTRGVTYYAYNTAGLLSQITDPRGKLTQFTYDTFSRVSTITNVTDSTSDVDPVTTFTYNSGNTVVTDANSHATTYYYDTKSRVTRINNPLGDSRKKEWNSNSDVTKSTTGTSSTDTPAGNDTTYNYDPSTNNLTQMTLPTGASVQFDYSSGGSATQYVPAGRTDAQGNHTTYAYDSRNNLKTSTEDSSTAQVKYDRQGDGTTTCGAKTGQICQMTDPRNKVTTYSYDSAGNLTGMTPPSPLGAQTYTPDSLSRVHVIADGRSQSTTYTYDPLDRLTQVTYNDSSTVTYAYDANGNLTQRVDATGTTTYSYDERNRLKQQNLPGSIVLQYTYDKVGNITSYTDATGTTTYAYDAADQIKELTEPNGTCTGTPHLKCTTYTFNRAGQRETVTYPNGVQMRFTYDNSNRETEMLATNSLGELLKYSYSYTSGTSDKGLVQKMTDPDGSKSHYTYDSLNRLTKSSSHVEQMQADAPVAWWRLGETSGSTAADSSGNSVNGTYSSSGITQGVNGAIAGETNQAAAFDGSAGVVTVADQSSLRLNGSFTIEFDAKLTQFVNTYPGILKKGDSYDATKTGFLIWYESNGNVHFKRNGQDTFTTGSGALVTDRFRHFAVTYDGINVKWYVDGVLKSTTAAVFATNIDLSSVQIGKGDTTNYGKTAIDEVAFYNKALSAADVKRHVNATNLGAAYTYDKSGNRTEQNDTFSRGLGATGNKLTYTYNDANELTARGSSSYSYDGNGNETAGYGQYTRTTTTYNAKDQATSFATSNGTLSSTYAAGDQFERYSAGALTFENSNLLGITASRTSGAGTATYYTRDPSGALHSVHYGSGTNATTAYYVFDGQGSVVGLTDSSGNLANKYTYDAYGIPLTTSETLVNPFRYIGGYQDATSGLTKFGLRYYDPTIGRFTQQDVMTKQGDPAGANRYTYASCNPTNKTDPSGAWDFDFGDFALFVGGSMTCAAIGFAANGIMPVIGQIAVTFACEAIFYAIGEMKDEAYGG
jgi:RHS repeat-associated protein